MICDACKSKKHFQCENVATCACQHRLTKTFLDGTITPLSERNTLLDAPEKENLGNITEKLGWVGGD